MKNAAAINFIDLASNDEVFIGIRYDETSVALAVSLKRNGDIEVQMEKKHAKKLCDALKSILEEE